MVGMGIQIDDNKTFYPASQQEWRTWLETNHLIEDSVWLIMYKKSSSKPSISWSDAVDEALCFGWIDSVKKKLDDERSVQFFSKRKPKSTWSRINKEKVERLMDHGLMFEAGLKIIEIAKQNGSWNILDDVEDLITPTDLEMEFTKNELSKLFYTSLSKSKKKMILHWILMAKRPETRVKRISEVIEKTSKNLLPNHMQ
jgi:uncharacterized protein YdeI (YjbR/CyaY-like superfamily)